MGPTALPVTASTFAPMPRTVATASRISRVSPLLLTAITTSSATTWPALPCTTSVACRNVAGVPVDEKSDAA